MKVMNKGRGLVHIGGVSIAPGATGEVDDSWANALIGDVVIVKDEAPKVASVETEEKPRRGRPSKVTSDDFDIQPD